MIISAIAAISRNRCIGKGNDIPWHVPADLRYFMQTTKGHHVIMGRKNFEAMGRPLKNRTNIVITRKENYHAHGCVVVHSIQEALVLAELNGESEAFIIGGGQIYEQVLQEKLIEKLYLTELDLEVDACEVFFPEIDPAEWTEISRRVAEPDEKNSARQTYLVYERKTVSLAQQPT